MFMYMYTTDTKDTFWACARLDKSLSMMQAACQRQEIVLHLYAVKQTENQKH